MREIKMLMIAKHVFNDFDKFQQYTLKNEEFVKHCVRKGHPVQGAPSLLSPSILSRIVVLNN